MRGRGHGKNTNHAKKNTNHAARMDRRRLSNGDQAKKCAAHAINAPVGQSWKGQWQRAA